MCKAKKTIFIFLIFFFVPVILCSEISILEYREGNIKVQYPEQVYPGAPLYFQVECNRKINKVTGVLYDNAGIKLGGTEGFKTKKNEKKFSGYIPLSTFTPFPIQGTLELKILTGKTEKTIFMPVKISEKNYPSYNLYLDDKNTAIMTDTSKEKQEQSNILYDIINNVSSDLPYETGNFIKPVNTERITSPFGQRRVYIYSSGKKYTSQHYGIDFGVPKGTPVHAAGSGKVVFADYRVLTGWSVIIEHSPGLYSLYYHMDSLRAVPGETVEKDEEIGFSGSTGLSTGPHLHWEIRCKGQAVDPFFFLDYK